MSHSQQIQHVPLTEQDHMTRELSHVEDLFITSHEELVHAKILFTLQPTVSHQIGYVIIYIDKSL
jgi:hypothetical protein